MVISSRPQNGEMDRPELRKQSRQSARNWALELSCGMFGSPKEYSAAPLAAVTEPYTPNQGRAAFRPTGPGVRLLWKNGQVSRERAVQAV